MKLYEIANQYESVLCSLYNPETGEVDENAMAILDSLQTDVKEKGLAIASYIKNLDAEREAIEKAKKAMAAREASLNNKVNYLSSYLQSNMERLGITEISCAYFIVKLKKNPVSVDDFDFEAIPAEYKRVETITKVDKRKIKDELLAGVVIPGAQLRQTNRLEIK